jgi:hypothetical protein
MSLASVNAYAAAMTEPTDRPRLIGELTLVPIEEGGRKRGIVSGYRGQALLSGVRDLSAAASRVGVEFNDCRLDFGEAILELGQSTTAMVYPLVAKHWIDVAAGDVVGLYEGYRLVGSIRITRPIRS